MSDDLRLIDSETDLYQIFDLIDQLHSSLEDLEKAYNEFNYLLKKSEDLQDLGENFSENIKKVYNKLSFLKKLKKVIFDKEKENIMEQDKRLRIKDKYETE